MSVRESEEGQLEAVAWGLARRGCQPAGGVPPPLDARIGASRGRAGTGARRGRVAPGRPAASGRRAPRSTPTKGRRRITNLLHRQRRLPPSRRSAHHAVSVPAAAIAAASSARACPGQAQLHGPVEALRVDHVHQHRADRNAQRQRRQHAGRDQKPAFAGHHRRGPARASGPGGQQAELPRRRASTCAEKLAAMPPARSRWPPPAASSRHREAAVEDAQRERAQLADRRELEQGRSGPASARTLRPHRRRRRPGRARWRVVAAQVAAEAAVVGRSIARCRSAGRSRATLRARSVRRCPSGSGSSNSGAQAIQIAAGL